MRRLARSAIAVSVLAAGGVSIAVLTAGGASAAAFAGGDFVVYRVGDGSTALSNAAAPVSLAEYAPTGGSPVQTIALPTSDTGGQHALTASGLSLSEGEISLSPDDRYLVVTGYDAVPGTNGPTFTPETGVDVSGSLTSTDPGTIARTIGRIDGNGLADTSTALSDTTTPSIIRSAATKTGTSFLVAGSPQTEADPGAGLAPTSTGGGVLSTALGGTSATVAAGGSANDLNGISIQGSTPTDAATFVSSSDGSTGGRIYTQSGSALTPVPGVSGSTLPYGYAFVSLPTNPNNFDGTGLNTLYVADSADHAGAIDKYVYNGTTWSLAGKIYLDSALGLAAVPTGTGSQVSIIVTTPTAVYSLTDPDGTDPGAFGGTLTQIVTAPSKDQFRGVAIAPKVPTGPSIVVDAPAAGAKVKQGTATVPFAAHVADGDGVAGVTVSLDGGTSVPATETGSTSTDDTWTTTLSTKSLALGDHSLSVTATDAVNSTLQTTVVSHFTIVSSVPKGDITKGNTSLLSALVRHSGFTTTTVSGAPLHNGRHLGLTTKHTGTVTFTFYGKTLTLHLVGSKISGEIVVTIAGKKHTVDLRKSKTEQFTVSFKSAAIAAHKVTISAPHKKDARSKGYTVTLGWLAVA